MEDKAADQGQVLVDGHLELCHVLARARDDDALSSGCAGDLGGLLEVGDESGRRVDEAGDVGDGSDYGAASERRDRSGGLERVACFFF